MKYYETVAHQCDDLLCDSLRTLINNGEQESYGRDSTEQVLVLYPAAIIAV